MRDECVCVVCSQLSTTCPRLNLVTIAACFQLRTLVALLLALRSSHCDIGVTIEPSVPTPPLDIPGANHARCFLFSDRLQASDDAEANVFDDKALTSLWLRRSAISSASVVKALAFAALMRFPAIAGVPVTEKLVLLSSAICDL